MSWTTALAIYFVAWWIVLFLVLPFGVRSQHETGEEVVPGTDPGAPVMPRLLRVVALNTVITAALCGFFFWLFLTKRLTFEDFVTLWGLLPSR
jgi:predicted secreted protein